VTSHLQRQINLKSIWKSIALSKFSRFTLAWQICFSDKSFENLF
jgi:hypothetical protein